MSDDNIDSQQDAPTTRHPETSRREILRSAALASGLAIPSADNRRSTSITTLTGSALNGTVLPDGFEAYDLDTPVPYARSLIELDDRFDEDDFTSVGFTEGRDDSNPRYTVSTMTAALPTPEVLPTVRTQFTEEFQSLMGEYEIIPGFRVTRQRTHTGQARSLRLHGSFQIDRDVLTDVDWAKPERSRQFDEYWAFNTTDDYVVSTAVFGYRGGPWRPEALFEHVTEIVNRHLPEDG